MEGKLFVIEGTDGSGKQTQADMLYNRLLKEQRKVVKIGFPNYDSESSSLVKMYLNGEFGADPDSVSPYAASVFYAVDRYATFQKQLKKPYENGYIILTDRYVTSNMIHQASKISDQKEKDKFISWLKDLEYVKFAIPVPTKVFFLDMPPYVSDELIRSRKNKFSLNTSKDIHEKNAQYMLRSYNEAVRCSEVDFWARICCVQEGILRSKESINEELYENITKYL